MAIAACEEHLARPPARPTIHPSAQCAHPSQNASLFLTPMLSELGIGQDLLAELESISVLFVFVTSLWREREIITREQSKQVWHFREGEKDRKIESNSESVQYAKSRHKTLTAMIIWEE